MLAACDVMLLRQQTIGLQGTFARTESSLLHQANKSVKIESTHKVWL
jgi:hypothetical protein